MTSRERKELITYLNRRIVAINDDVFVVDPRPRKGRTVANPYLVSRNDDGDLECNCEGYDKHGACKHVAAVKKHLGLGPAPEKGYGAYDEDKRPRYDEDAVRMKVVRQIFMKVVPFMIRALARHVFPVQRTPITGRPFTELSDAILSLSYRTIYHCSGLMAQAFVNDAFKQRLLYRRPILNPQPPSVPALTANLAHERVHDALLKLIEVSNKPYEGSDDVVALDGSEFNIRSRHFRHTKRSGITSNVSEPASAKDSDGTELRHLATKTMKLHACVSVKTGMVIAATVTYGKDGEAPEAIPLLELARRTRFVKGVVADRGYPSAELYAYAHRNNMQIAVPPRSNFKETNQDDDSPEQLIMREYVRAWKNRTEDEKSLYGKRQKVENTFFRIKELTTEDLRSKTFEGQRSELLLEVLVVNMMTLVREYVFGRVQHIVWLDERSRAILDNAREAVKDHPHRDPTPHFRDGLAQSGSTEAA